MRRLSFPTIAFLAHAACGASGGTSPPPGGPDGAVEPDLGPEVAAGTPDVPPDAPREIVPEPGPSVNEVNPLLLHGKVPEVALDAPEFVATSHDGTTRGKPDLLGHPTVMWFFPFSGTPG